MFCNTEKCRFYEDDLLCAFANVVLKEIPKSKQKWTLSAEELIESLDITGPF